MYEAAGAVESSFSILALVPAEAPAVICLDGLSRLESVYSVPVLDSLDWGKFASCKTVLSFFFESKLHPCLYIDAGRLVSEDDPDLSALLAATAARNLQFKLLQLNERSVLFFTPSNYALANQEYSMSAGTSILDAPFFKESMDHTPIGNGVRMYFRNRDAIKLLPKFFLASHWNKKTVSAFLSGFSTWTVLTDESAKSWNIVPLLGDNDAQFGSFFTRQASAKSTVSEIVPDVSSFLIDIPIASWKQRRSAYEHWLEAKSGISAYKRRLAEIRVKTGKDPYEWEKMISPKEIAFMHFSKYRIVAIRTGARFSEHDVAPNPYAGCAGALFGSAFGYSTESHYACKGRWLIIGAEDDVKAFMKLSAGCNQLPFGGKTISYGVWERGHAAVWDESGLVHGLLYR